MMDIKKLVKNRETRNDLMGLLRFIPDEAFLRLMYRVRMSEKLDLDNPKTFNQKLQWLKLYDRKDIYSSLVDKYEVKKYVSSLIGDEYVVDTYGIYDKFSDIDFNRLPQSFAIKCTHDSGGLYVCRNKQEFDLELAKKKISRSLRLNYYWVGREWPYKNVIPRIMVEKYLEQNLNNNSEIDKNGLIDYKFYCFNGVPKFLYISQGLEKHETARIDFLSCEWERMPFSRRDYRHFEKLPARPSKLDEMKRIAEILSKGISFVRVDFYYVKNHIFFSELTLFPGSGYTKIYPEQYDACIGEMLNLDMVGKH